MQVIFDHSREEADNISTFFFRSEKPVDYTAGQFVQIFLPHADPDKRGQKRWFTLSSSPSDDLLSITTKFPVEGMTSTYKQTLLALEPGTSIEMSDPMGDFVLPKDAKIPLVFVAGGIGITPYHSMLSWLASQDEERNIKLLYGVNNEDEIIFQETFAKANVHATIVVGNSSPAWGGERGQLTAELILGLEQPEEGTLVFVSGPEPMVENLHKQLKKAGLHSDQLVGDYFPNYQEY